MDYSEQDATLICGLLLRQGYIKKRDYVRMELDEHLMREVQERLAQVGMELVHNSYSPFYAVRLITQAQDVIEQSNNLGLKNNEVAMLVILWSKLILPKRMTLESPPLPEAPASISELDVASTAPDHDGDSSGLDAASTEAKDEAVIATESENAENLALTPDDPHKLFVRVPELYAEFGRHFGSKTAFKSTLTRLSNLQFLRVHNEIITEGIFLDLLIDGHQMGNEIKRSALAYKLAGLGDDEEWDDESLEEDEEDEEADKLSGENSEESAAEN